MQQLIAATVVNLVAHTTHAQAVVSTVVKK